jgi:hypothetical protein
MSSNLSELEKIKFESRLSLGEHSLKLNKMFSNNPDLALTFSNTSSFFKELSKAKDKYLDFPNMCSNIPASPAYGVYISQLIRYARASINYSDFLKRHLHLRNRLLDQG